MQDMMGRAEYDCLYWH